MPSCRPAPATFLSVVVRSLISVPASSETAKTCTVPAFGVSLSSMPSVVAVSTSRFIIFATLPMSWPLSRANSLTGMIWVSTFRVPARSPSKPTRFDAPWPPFANTRFAVKSVVVTLAKSMGRKTFLVL